MNSIQTICICGAGTMGSGIAQVAAQSGFQTILYDVNAAALEKARPVIGKNLQLLQHKQKLSAADATEALRCLRFSNQPSDCIADIFIEAIAEQPEIKAALFNQLNEINHSEVIFATNTSSLSITGIAAGVLNPSRVAGMHFFNPAPVMKLVEVVQGELTSDATMQIITELAVKMGKIPVRCKDAPGFIVNHVARPYYLEALRLMEKGIPPETIDALMESTGFKMGPFRLMDLIGNDVNYAVSESIYHGLGQPERLKPSAIQKDKIARGELGRKSGKGYYDYDN
jgi:3-hydroxybutyryl-CoA dehydrogenase